MLGNAGFRELLSKKEEEEKPQKDSGETQEERQRKKAKAQASYERRMAIQKRREEALTESSRYTDRAAERRKEETKEGGEGSEIPERFDALEEEGEEAQNPAEVSSAPTYAQLGDREDLGQQSHRVSIAQSKYLGGDIEHTHLVKGLDFALLQKMRSELGTKPTSGASKEKGGSSGAKEGTTAGAKGAPRQSAPSSGSNATKTSSSTAATAKPGKDQKLAFATEMGRDVHRAIFGVTSRPNKALAEVSGMGWDHSLGSNTSPTTQSFHGPPCPAICCSLPSSPPHPVHPIPSSPPHPAHPILPTPSSPSHPIPNPSHPIQFPIRSSPSKSRLTTPHHTIPGTTHSGLRRQWHARRCA